MRIRTVNFGELDIPEDRIIDFIEGLPGFPQIRRFAVLEFEDLKPFQYLQALDDPPIALLLINPFLVDPNYAFQLSSVDMEEIQSVQSKDVTVYAVAAIPDNPEKATVNLMAPIVVNEKLRKGKQVILHESGYSLKHPLFAKSEDGGAQIDVRQG
jgi:flagellar assembly factor FliW